ncbi:MAG TPA: hypothetical protein VGJ86_09660 [Acidimicrobiales bacterium]|jgi:hypothetical protein
MSIPDAAARTYAELCADFSPAQVADLERRMVTEPATAKRDLAEAIVARYHGEVAAKEARGAFDRVFKHRELPQDLPVVRVELGPVDLAALLVGQGMATSKSEVRRLAAQGGLKLDAHRWARPTWWRRVPASMARSYSGASAKRCTSPSATAVQGRASSGSHSRDRMGTSRMSSRRRSQTAQVVVERVEVVEVGADRRHGPGVDEDPLLHYPRPEEYFADPSAHHEYARSQFDGIRVAPWQSWDLNRLAFHPDLVDLAGRRARFMLLAGYEVWGPRWTGRMGWPTDSLGPHWTEMMERATPRERELFGFPAIGDPYWNDQTLTDVQCRYPRMDMTPYSGGARV